MTMSFLLHDPLSDTESSEISAAVPSNHDRKKISAKSTVTVIEEKLRIPGYEPAPFHRERLLELLERSIEQYGATLISGRAGSGKSVLAADFARDRPDVSWFSIEPADSDWRDFTAVFSSSLFGKGRFRFAASTVQPQPAEVADYLTRCFAKLKTKRRQASRLIVLDNVHHLFDAPWFTCFFQQLIASVDENVRLLLLCRSKPSAPLWRMRSKQMLNVIDEHLLDLTESEAREICRSRGLPLSCAADARRRSFGRVSNFLKELDALSNERD